MNTMKNSQHSDLVRMLCVSVLVFTGYFRLVQGHGHLVDPPARSSMWQEGFRTPPNYNQNQLNCGGFYNHWILNGGKCGVCGDPYQSAAPRDNESGGKYGKGIITRTYSQGQKVTLKVLVTANHQGWFEFRLCPNGSPTTPVTQSCLDQYVLPLADGSGNRYSLGPQERSVSVDVMLPPGVSCTQCVIQWKWRAGNNYGRDPDGTTCKGCGAQEEFYGCSDVAITTGNNNGGGQTQRPPVTTAPVIAVTTPTSPPTIGTLRPPQTTAAPIVTFPPITRPQYTNAVQTYGPIYPTMRPINFPLFTTPAPYNPTARPPITTQKPVVTSPAPSSTSPAQPTTTTNNNNNGATWPTGFVPISINPNINPAPVNPTSAPPSNTVNPPYTFAPVRTNTPPYVTQTPRPTFYRPPSTTSRLHLITTRAPKSTSNPNIFNPRTTPQLPPFVTLRPFTLFPPFIMNSKQTTKTTPPFFRPQTTKTTPPFFRPQTTKTTPSFFRPQTTPRPPSFTLRPIATTPSTPRPIFTFRPVQTTPPFYRPPTTPRPAIITNPQTPPPTTFYRPPTTKAPAATTQQPPRPVTSKLNRCYAINSWKGVAELENYCHVQCNMANGVCPTPFCECQP